jgi:hypothetical protein
MDEAIIFSYRLRASESARALAEMLAERARLLALPVPEEVRGVRATIPMPSPEPAARRTWRPRC